MLCFLGHKIYLWVTCIFKGFEVKVNLPNFRLRKVFKVNL